MRTLLVLVGVLGSACLQGSGRATTQSREVPAFKRLDVQSGIKATVTPGARSVAVTFDDNLIEQIEATVAGDTLTLKTRSNSSFSTSLPVAVTITNDLIEGVRASGGAGVVTFASPVTSWDATLTGGASLDVSGLSSTTVTLSAAGGSQLTAAGVATDVTVTAASGSIVDTTRLPATRLTVDFSGGSTGRVRATNAVSGKASGGSTLTVSGTTSVAVEVTGGSTLELK